MSSIIIGFDFSNCLLWSKVTATYSSRKNGKYPTWVHKQYWNGVISKMLPFSWAETVLTTTSRSFQRGNVSPCSSKGCKVMVRQSLKMIQLSRTWSQAAHLWFDSEGVAEIFFKPPTLTAYTVYMYWVILMTLTFPNNYKKNYWNQFRLLNMIYDFATLAYQTILMTPIPINQISYWKW